MSTAPEQNLWIPAEECPPNVALKMTTSPWSAADPELLVFHGAEITCDPNGFEQAMGDYRGATNVPDVSMTNLALNVAGFNATFRKNITSDQPRITNLQFVTATVRAFKSGNFVVSKYANVSDVIPDETEINTFSKVIDALIVMQPNPQSEFSELTDICLDLNSRDMCTAINDARDYKRLLNQWQLRLNNNIKGNISKNVARLVLYGYAAGILE